MTDHLTRRDFVTAASALAGAALLPTAAAAGRALVGSADGSVVLFQGDSITDAGRDRGVADPNSASALGSGYPLLVASAALAAHPDRGLRFYNRGISGNKVPDLAARWAADTVALAPDVLSILIGVNDFWHTLSSGYTGTSRTTSTSTPPCSMTPGVPCRAPGSSCSSRSCCAAAPWTIAGSPNSTSVAPPPSGSRGARARRSSHSSGCSTTWRAAARRNTGPPMASTPRPPATPPSRSSGVARRSCDRRSVVPRRPPGGTGRAVAGVPGQHRGDPRARSRRLSLPLSPHTGARARWPGRAAPGIRRVRPGRRRRLARHSGRDPLPHRAADPGRGLRRVPLPRGRFERQRARRQRARPGAHTRWVEGRGDHRIPDARRGAAPHRDRGGG